VLGFVVTDSLYRTHPDQPEGELAKMRAATVSQKSLAAIARELGLGRFIRLGKGELRTKGYEKDSILSDTVEAVIGAVYLAEGQEAAAALVHRLVDATLARAADLGAGLDWKTSLQELAGELGVGVPEYTWEAEGPAHARVFTSHVSVGPVLGSGTGSAKKHAEQEAAERAYRALEAYGTGRAGQAASAGA
jgi:ribonuclease-3